MKSKRVEKIKQEVEEEDNKERMGNECYMIIVHIRILETLLKKT